MRGHSWSPKKWKSLDWFGFEHSKTRPRGICNGTFGKWGDNRGKLRLQMGRFWGKFMVLKAPSYTFSLEAHIEGAAITIMYQITYSKEKGLFVVMIMDSATK